MATVQTGVATSFIDFSRGTNATVTDSDGFIKWAPHNLVINSGTPATQSITVISGIQYTVNMTGSGSITLSNAGSGSVTTGSPVTITASTTTLTLTVVGTVLTMWAYRSDLGGMQLNGSNSLYNPTTSTAYYGPRRDFNGSTLACKGLLIEEQRANLLTYSEDFRDTADAGTTRPWGYANITVTPNSGLAPSGQQTADKLIATSTSGSHSDGVYLTSPAAGTYTASAYVKDDGYGFVAFQMTFGGLNVFRSYNLSTGAVVASAGTATSFDPVNVGGGWWRFAISFTTSSTSDGVFFIRVENDGSGGNWSGNGTSGILVWGAQLEINAAFATSQIPTSGTSITRNADIASVNAQAFPYNSNESTLIASFSKFVTSSRGGVAVLAGSSGALPNSLTIDAQNDAKMRAFSDVDNTNPYLNTIVGTYTANTTQKLAIAYAENNANAAANGTAGTTDTSAGLPVDIDLLQLGAIKQTTVAASTFLNGHIRQITYLPRRISDSELTTRTSA